MLSLPLKNTGTLHHKMLSRNVLFTSEGARERGRVEIEKGEAMEEGQGEGEM